MKRLLIVILTMIVATPVAALDEGPFREAPRRYVEAGRVMDAAGLIDYRFVPFEELSWRCSGETSSRLLGCANFYHGPEAEYPCIITVRNDLSPAYAARLIDKHERPHCAGWRHP